MYTILEACRLNIWMHNIWHACWLLKYLRWQESFHLYNLEFCTNTLLYCIYSTISRAIFTQIKAKVQWNFSPKGGCGFYSQEFLTLISWANSTAIKDRIERVTTNLNVKLAKHRNLVPACQNIWQKQVSQLKSHIGKPFTTREGVNAKECETIRHMFGQTCASKHLPGH